MYVLVGFGVTIGFHRLLDPPLVRGQAVAARHARRPRLDAVQGAVIHWVADHRKHHTFTDEEGDPHSPHTHGAPGWRGVLTGLWHSHMGWLFDGERPRRAASRPTSRGPADRMIDSLFPVWALLGLALPFVLGFALSGGTGSPA